MPTPDLEFFFDPSCPFCWITSKWVRVVRDELGIEVRWSYISLETLNAPYDDEVYETWHHGGRRMHRVIAAAAEEHGQDIVGPLYEAIGTAIWESSGPTDQAGLARAMGEKADLPVLLERLGLSTDLASAVDDDSLPADRKPYWSCAPCPTNKGGTCEVGRFCGIANDPVGAACPEYKGCDFNTPCQYQITPSTARGSAITA